MNDAAIYGHPVLSEASEDYQSSAFSTKLLSREEQGAETVLHVACNLSCDGLAQMVADGDARVILRATCYRTSWRVVYELSLSEPSEIRIAEADVKEKIGLQAMVVATRNIEDFRLAEFSAGRFGGRMFRLHKGDVLAVESERIIRAGGAPDTAEHGVHLVAFSEEAFGRLKDDLFQNENRYYDDAPWLESYFEQTGIQSYLMPLDIVVPDIQFVYSGDDHTAKNRDELYNTRLLYEAYKGKLSPRQATDPLLWTALCHVRFHDYVMKRWKKPDGTVNIKKRFFASSGRTELCYYNAVSRLWWSAYLTYDEERALNNPYHLTDVLFSAQQIQKDLLDQSFSMSRNVVKGVLSAWKRIRQEWGGIGVDVFRACCSYDLQKYGKATILDTLSAKEVEEIARAFMKQHIPSEEN